MAEHTVIMETTLRKLLAEKKYATLREILITMNPADIAAKTGIPESLHIGGNTLIGGLLITEKPPRLHAVFRCWLAPQAFNILERLCIGRHQAKGGKR